jgi:hypothetical protein
MYIGGAVLAAAAPLYIPAWRQERARRTDERRLTAEPTGVGQ